MCKTLKTFDFIGVERSIKLFSTEISTGFVDNYFLIKILVLPPFPGVASYAFCVTGLARLLPSISPMKPSATRASKIAAARP